VTCIAAVPTSRGVVMAADSCEVDDDGTVFRCDRKMFTVPVGRAHALVGCAGNSSVMSLMRYRVQMPPAPQPRDRDGEDEWAHLVAEAFTEAARAANIVNKDGDIDANVLLAFRGRLWTIEEAYAAPMDIPTAIGTGAPYALGALAALPVRMAAVRRARRAVEIACDLSVTCRAPVHVAVL
jgi:hypothetical protein